MLNKTEIAREVEARTGIKPNLTTNVINTITDIAASEVSKGEAFSLPGLVKITPRYKAATKKRMGRNPQTGDEVEIGPKPASIRVTARVLSRVKKSAPSATSKAGKALKK